jgi:hypothetical protein
MVKRTIDNAQITPAPPASKKGLKRRRTDEFLQKTSIFDSAMSTCRFFEANLIQDTHSEREEEPSSPSADSIRGKLRESMLMLELDHDIYCAEMRKEASNAIQLKESFRQLTAGIDSRISQSDTPLLSMLNLGPEANHFLKQSISAYAGVPSIGDFQDWQNLDLLLR